MKKLLLPFLLTVLTLSCNKKEQVDSLYKKYEHELIQGNTIKAEEYLDEIINVDKNNPKYLKLKIPLLVNKCKKTEAIKFIDEILNTDKQDIDLTVLKILLLPDNDIKN